MYSSSRYNQKRLFLMGTLLVIILILTKLCWPAGYKVLAGLVVLAFLIIQVSIALPRQKASKRKPRIHMVRRGFSFSSLLCDFFENSFESLRIVFGNIG